MKLIAAHTVSLFLLLIICNRTAAQAPAAQDDTTRIIQIIQGKSLRQKTIDSGFVIETIAGNVILKERGTLFICDSAVINHHTNVLEAFGNVHINQNDSINTYAQHLRYVGNDRIAWLDNNVKLVQNKGTLYTQSLKYDLKTNIGDYTNGGKVINGKTTLTSENGTYYADTKDVYFKNNVHLVDPTHEIITDSLLYNTETQITTFITQTYIKAQKGGNIYTSEGTYDLKTGSAFFGKRTIIKDSSRIYISDQSAYDQASGIFQLEGNAVVKDSVNGYTIIGGQIFSNQKTNTVLATRKPVLIFVGEKNDSTFIAADTLFSGLKKRDTIVTAATDTNTVIKQPPAKLSLGNKFSFKKKTDSLTTAIKDSAQTTVDSLLPKNDSAQIADSMKTMVDSLVLAASKAIDSAKKIAADTTFRDTTLTIKEKQDSLSLTSIDTLKKPTVINAGADTSLRYFLAFHHVRIFNDSLQSVCDSLFYSAEDSVFRLFYDPLVFSHQSQISGDTIFLYTKNKKADMLRVFESAMMINQPDPHLYNQMAGTTMTGYFKNGGLDYLRVKGSPAESIYFPQNDDSSYIGMNRSKGDLIDVFFINREVNKVKFINDVDGTLYPLKQIPTDQKFLPGFKWWDERRPKNKLELFE
ncbi:OstA-like protein [Ferruginibacter albus]|uniref:OstA-like protein n=1 Tax=Ferruginibacter albus TaxID=2875540 RepID=UPI001CC7BBF3|nr:OstA-like protein [Ferruginibacter albus]UAY53378.1 OstA family protein [Ferruginibacter albus]